jgi:hypothetical protein
MFGLSAQDGLGYAQFLRDRRIDFENDLRAGWPCSFLAERHYGGPLALYPNGPVEFAGYLKMLRDARIGQFADLREDPPWREVALSGEDCSVAQDTEGWTFTLKKPQRVYAVRLMCVFEVPTPSLELLWRERGRNEFSEDERNYGFTLFVRPQSSVIIWVDDTIDQLRLHTSAPGAVRVARIDLLLPAAEH